MVIVQLIGDDREPFRKYDKAVPWFGTAPEALMQGFEQIQGVEVHVVSCTQQLMVASPEKLAENIWFHSLHVPKLGWLRTGYQGCIRAARRKIRELNPDIVHGQGTERDCAISAVFSGYPNVITIHGNMAPLARLFGARIGTYLWLAARLEDFALPRAAGVFCNSAYTEGEVASRARRTWRVPNAIRSEFFAPVSQGDRSGNCVVLNVGVIMPRKRQLELLDLARRLHERGVRMEWRFVGRADERDPYAIEFLARVCEGERRGYARYLGTLETPGLIAQFDEAAAFVHFPSEEAFGLVVAEALARNARFFGARLGGIEDIASGVDDAELFPGDDWDGLLNALERWYLAGFPRPTQAAETMRERYSPQVVAKRHLEIYREVLSTRS